jgi:hypothetical protein
VVAKTTSGLHYFPKESRMATPNPRYFSPGERTYVSSSAFADKLMDHASQGTAETEAVFGLNDDAGEHHRLTSDDIHRIEPHPENGKLKIVLSSGTVIVVTVAAVAAAIKGLRYVRRK